MKLHIHILMIIGLLGLTSSLSYAQSEDTDISIKEIRKETKELFNTIGNYTVDKKDETLKKAKESLNKLDERVDNLESNVDEKWDKMSDAVRMQTRENLRALRKQRNEVAQWYGNMQSSTADAWEYTKKGFSSAYKDLEKAWAKSEKEFSSK